MASSAGVDKDKTFHQMVAVAARRAQAKAKARAEADAEFEARVKAEAEAEFEAEAAAESSSSGGEQPLDGLGWIRGGLEGWSLSGWSLVDLTDVGHRPCCVHFNVGCWGSHTSKEDHPYRSFLCSFSSDDEEEEDEEEKKKRKEKELAESKRRREEDNGGFNFFEARRQQLIKRFGMEEFEEIERYVDRTNFIYNASNTVSFLSIILLITYYYYVLLLFLMCYLS
ncbi:hypothetical protein Tsubulata_033738 [Turnera subulata]|uniref:Uncharacterized protein n=1 Tax=Turnera subulata TaxID=218843 RepID=A0A9Q0GFI9_9ROSI|nr:hypothetical protein Tsubulata_033738 [Turnera subulata]